MTLPGIVTFGHRDSFAKPRLSKADEIKRKDVLAKLETMQLLCSTTRGFFNHLEIMKVFFQYDIETCFKCVAGLRNQHLMTPDDSMWSNLFHQSQQLLFHRHKQSWEEVHKFVDENLKVWPIKPTQVILPTVLPWLETSMDAMTFMRTDQEEGTLLWVNLPTVGVVSAMKRDFFLQTISGLLAAKASNSACLVLHANRASESKQKKTNRPQLLYTNKRCEFQIYLTS